MEQNYSQMGQNYNQVPPTYRDNQSTEKPPMPETYLIWAILSTILCCLPLGIVAIIKASKVESLYFSGAYEQAYKASNDAKKFAIIGAIIWVAFSLLYIIVAFVLLLADGATDYYY